MIQSEVFMESTGLSDQCEILLWRFNTDGCQVIIMHLMYFSSSHVCVARDTAGIEVLEAWDN